MSSKMPAPTPSASATPRPWKLSRPHATGTRIMPKPEMPIDCVEIYCNTPGCAPSGYRPIASFPYATDEPESAANAALIVTAVNSHDALVEALEVLCDAVVREGDHGDGATERGCHVCDAMTAGRRALALARPAPPKMESDNAL